MSKNKILICFPLWAATSSIDIMRMLAEQAEKNIAIAVDEVNEPGAIKEGEYEDEAFDHYGKIYTFMSVYYSCGACVGTDYEEVKLEYIRLTTQLTRRSAFLTIYGLFEHRINDCLEFMLALAKYTGEIKGRGPIEKIHYLIRRVYGCKSITDVDHLTKIRNIMIHNDGIANNYIDIFNGTDKKNSSEKRLLNAIRRSEGVVVNDFNEVLMNESFLIYSVNEFKRYINALDDLINAYYRQVSNRKNNE
ncbi:TPA: hypothetical protein SLP32_002123 [Enterobacter mori]|nr:hypothetical protein [Enterobacter mori]